MSGKAYNVFAPKRGVPIKAWTRGVALEDEALKQLLNVAKLQLLSGWTQEAG